MTKDSGGKEISLSVDIAENPFVRALLRLIPHGVGSAADVLITHRADQIKKQRARVFFECLASGNLQLDADLVASNDFLHSFDATLRAALRSRREEKIRMFARLLDHGMLRCEARSVDDYEELVSLLDQLSFREWEALILFDSHLRGMPSNENPLARVAPIWVAFVDELENMLGVPKSEASSFMIRIARTGLFNEITGGYMDYGGGQGITTPLFDRVRLLVREH